MSESRRQLLSIGVFCIIVVVAILLYAVALITNWANIIQTILILFGIWMLVLAAIRAQNPQKYESSAFRTLEMGIILIALGAAWFLLSINWLYSIALLILVIGVTAIAAALRRKKP